METFNRNIEKSSINLIHNRLDLYLSLSGMFIRMNLLLLCHYGDLIAASLLL